MSIAKSSLYSMDGKNIETKVYDWEYIYKTAVRYNMDSIIYPVLAQSEVWTQFPISIRERWESVTKSKLMIEAKKYFAIKRILAEAKKEDIKMVFFKGCVIADLYPQYLLRVSGDSDIFVYERDHEKAERLLERLGYIKNDEHSKEKVPVYHNYQFYHIVELHFCLWEDYEGKKMSILESMDLTNENSLLEVTACGIQLLTLGYEEHLIYQMFHIIKHFSIETVGLRYMADITLFINKYYTQIDIDSFWTKMKRLGYASFCCTFFELCIEYLDMDIRIMKEMDHVSKVNKDELFWDMVSAGNLFEEKVASWQIIGIITPYLTGEETIPTSKFARKLKVLFPSRNALPDNYTYAKKYGILLPIAWLHKIIYYVIRYKRFYREQKGVVDGEWYGASQKLAVAEYRLHLMKDLGLVEKE